MYRNRIDAGEQLAEAIKERGYKAPIIFALTRGGVPVGLVVAKELKAPLEPVIARKLSDKTFPELGFGAIAPLGALVIDNTIVDEVGIDHEEIERIKLKQEKSMLRQINQYGAKLDLGDLSKKTAILVDDGIATGISVRAAARFLRKFKPGTLVLAAPVCPTQIFSVLKRDFDDIVCVAQEEYLFGVSQFYQEFPQVTDEEVIELLKNR